MQEKDKILFELLKQKIVAVMQQSYPGINTSISDWKGQELTDFQEDLRIKVSANISEKWFYTHIKASHTALPRIDMLNFLSRYAGYANWDDFVYRNASIPEVAVVKQRNPNVYFLIIPLAALVVCSIFFGLFKLFNTREYRFHFVDAVTHEAIRNSKTSITILNKGESPAEFMAEENGTFLLKTDQSKIKMIIESPYYQTDTIEKVVTKLEADVTVMLRPDDYALMIHYFSTMNVDDWEKRRNKLNEMIADDAMICQVMGKRGNSGMALYNKSEFIDKLTMPVGSLRNIEILGSQVREGKIVVLRFQINTGKQ